MLSFGFFGFSLSLVAAYNCDVRLYEHSHTTAGDKCTIHENTLISSLSSSSAAQGCPANGELSRVQVDGNCYVDLYHSTSYGGTHQRLWGNGDYSVSSSNHFQNDAVKSVRVRNAYCPSASKPYAVDGSCRQCRVTLGEHKTSNHNNMGRWCEKYEGYQTGGFSSSSGCPGMNKISYIKIEGNCDMEVFEDSSYGGHEWFLSGPGTYYSHFGSGGDQHYENDEINSFKIFLSRRRRREAAMNSDRVTFMISEEAKSKAGLPMEPEWKGHETQLIVQRVDDEAEEIERLENRVMQELEEQERELIREEERMAKTADRLFELEEREEAAAPALRDTSRAPPAMAGLLDKVRDYLSHRSTDDDDQE